MTTTVPWRPHTPSNGSTSRTAAFAKVASPKSPPRLSDNVRLHALVILSGGGALLASPESREPLFPGRSSRSVSKRRGCVGSGRVEGPFRHNSPALKHRHPDGGRRSDRVGDPLHSARDRILFAVESLDELQGENPATRGPPDRRPHYRRSAQCCAPTP